MLRTDATTRIQGQVVKVTASVGLVETRREVEMSAGELLGHADVALYEAKDAGRGTISVTDLTHDEGTAFQARLKWAERIRKTLEEDQFVLFQQPIVTLATGAVERRELLLRMRTEDDELVEAGSFLPVAEHFNQMTQIDLWAIRYVLEGLRTQALTAPAAGLHLNLSGASVSDPGFLATVAEWIATAELDARSLVFEIGETAAIESIEHARQLCAQLRELGCEVALDDFGSGFGALSHLKQLPFDCLKVDGGLITQLTHSDVDRIAVRAIVDMAHGLGKTTVAKGVEDERTLELVRELGVDCAQGFHIGRPAAFA